MAYHNIMSKTQQELENTSYKHLVYIITKLHTLLIPILSTDLKNSKLKKVYKTLIYILQI